MNRTLHRFLTNERAVAAVEFALVGGLFIFTILFIMIIALFLFIGQSLDYATQKAARLVMTGVVQTTGVGQSTFRTSILCPLLPASISCSNIVVNLYTVPEGSKPNGYYAFTNGGSAGGLLLPSLSSGSGQFSPGIQGQYEYLLVIYPITFIPAVFAPMLGITSFNGQAAFPIIATAAFRNEQY